MPITQTRNQDLEKRLAHLRSQLYGKNSGGQQVSISTVAPINRHTNTTQAIDLDYLRQDLLRIFILAGLAFTFQFSLYFAMVSKLIKLPF